MRKSLAISLIAIVASVALVCYKFGPRSAAHNAAPVGSEQAAVTPHHSPAASPASTEAGEEVQSAVSPEKVSDNGLIKLQLNSTFSPQLPSIAAQKQALAMNARFYQNSGK